MNRQSSYPTDEGFEFVRKHLNEITEIERCMASILYDHHTISEESKTEVAWVRVSEAFRRQIILSNYDLFVKALRSIPIVQMRGSCDANADNLEARIIIDPEKYELNVFLEDHPCIEEIVIDFIKESEFASFLGGYQFFRFNLNRWREVQYVKIKSVYTSVTVALEKLFKKQPFYMEQATAVGLNPNAKEFKPKPTVDLDLCKR